MIKQILAILKGFAYAINGIRLCILHERNMRIHITAAALVIFFSGFYDFDGTEKAILALTIAAVISCEMINTAVERAVDLTADRCELARFAKDAAAGAVLISAVSAVFVAYFLFWDTAVFAKVAGEFSANSSLWIILSVIILAGLLFIFIPSIKGSNKRGIK